MLLPNLDINFQMSPLNSDPHFGGKQVQKLNFIVNDISLALVCKPRSAAIDMAVISLFNDLNRLEDNAKSSTVKLPIIKIMDFPKQNMSIWEYIEGTQPSGEDNLEKFITSSNLKQEQKLSLQSQLNRLEAVCKACQVSDLHLENILINIKDDQHTIFLIDLESIQRKETGLVSNAYSSPQLTDVELKLIHEFNKKIKSIPFRLVIADTGTLKDAMVDENLLKTAKEIDQIFKSFFQKEKFDLLSTEIESLIFEDFLNDDIPYLTQIGGEVYYGGECIARRSIT